MVPDLQRRLLLRPPALARQTPGQFLSPTEASPRRRKGRTDASMAFRGKIGFAAVQDTQREPFAPLGYRSHHELPRMPRVAAPVAIGQMNGCAGSGRFD